MRYGLLRCIFFWLLLAVNDRITAPIWAGANQKTKFCLLFPCFTNIPLGFLDVLYYHRFIV